MRSSKLDALDVLAGDWVLGDPSSPTGGLVQHDFDLLYTRASS